MTQMPMEIDYSQIEARLLAEMMSNPSGRLILNAGRRSGRTAALAALYGARAGDPLGAFAASWHLRLDWSRVDPHDWTTPGFTPGKMAFFDIETDVGDHHLGDRSRLASMAGRWRCEKCGIRRHSPSESRRFVTSGKHAVFHLTHVDGPMTCESFMVLSTMLS